MGRKIATKKLEPAFLRRTTFSNRYKGLAKKAEELSVLCDVPVLLVTTTTSGGHKVFVEKNRSFSDVIQQYVNESEENLAKTKMETIKLLRKSFTDGHIVNVNGKQPTEGKEYSELQLEKTKQAIAELEHCLGPLRNVNQLEKVESIEELLAMERSIRYLIARNKEIKAYILEQQKATFQHFFTSYGRDLRYSTSTAVPAITTVPMPSNHIDHFYGSSNPPGSMQPSDPTVCGSSNPTGSMQLHGPAVGSDSNPTGSVPQHGPTFGSGRNPTGSMQQNGTTFGSGINPTRSMQQNGPTVSSGSNPTGINQVHGLAVGIASKPTGSVPQNGATFDSGINPTGSVQQHGLTFGSSINPTGNVPQHGPTFDSGINQTGCVQLHGTTFGSGINPTRDMQQNGPTVGSGSNPNGIMQVHGLAIRRNSNLGTVPQHGTTFGSGSNPTRSVQQHGPTVLSDTAWNMPERAGFKDCNSILDPLKGNLSEGDGQYQDTLGQYDVDSLVGLFNLLDSNDGLLLD